MKMNGVVIGLLAAGVGAYLLLKDKQGATTTAQTPEDQKAAILTFLQNAGAGDTTNFKNVLDQMSNDELQVVYSYIFDYVAKGTEPEPGPFTDQLRLIADKYQIFT